MATIGLGESIPPDTDHAVSVSLPTWKANVGYEEGAPWVMSTLTTGYPRFFVHKSIQAFAASIAERYGQPGQTAMLFPSRKAGERCLAFARKMASPPSVLDNMTLVFLALDPSRPDASPFRPLAPTISAVIMNPDAFPFAKQYWQHSGDGISSRRAEYCHKLFLKGLLTRVSDHTQVQKDVRQATTGLVPAELSPPLAPARAPASAVPAQPLVGMKPFRGPKRYRRPMSPSNEFLPHERPLTPRSPGHSPDPAQGRVDSRVDDDETSRFLEERFGRNLDLSFVQRAGSAIRRRITGALTADNDVELDKQPHTTTTAVNGSSNIRGAADIHEDDVYLVPCGMNAIFNAHQYLLAGRKDKAHLRSINFGFPYVDTLKILQKFGAGCQFYGHASEEDLDDLEARLKGGERFLALFCEFPGNPLLSCPNLTRIRQLADTYDFAVVVDETIGTFVNINVLPFADVVVSSLTKIFSGDCNVMGGSIVLNSRSRYYATLKAVATAEYDWGAYWPEDVIFMERNSRDFAARVDRINANAEAVCEVLLASPLVKSLYYPKYGAWRDNYEVCRIGSGHGVHGNHGNEGGRVGGYGGLLSFVFHHQSQAKAFFDAVETAKGPSLGTNFTLTSPYVVLAHYNELHWCSELGVDPDLLRVSVGLEDTNDLRRVFQEALDVTAKVPVQE